MTDSNTDSPMQDLDVTIWVGKNGIEAVADELENQLSDRAFVKVKFLRSARGSTDTDELAENLADRVSADLVETRGNIAVIQ